MKLITDSSALSKRYVLEAGSDKINQFLQNASQLGLCTILVSEIISALNRRRREKILASNDYRTIKRQLMEDVHDAVMLQGTPSVISHSVRLFLSFRYRCLGRL